MMVKKDRRIKIDDEALQKLMVWRPKLYEVAAFFNMTPMGVEAHIRKKHNQTYLEYRAKHTVEIKGALIGKALRMAFHGNGNLEAIKYLMNNIGDWSSAGNAEKTDEDDQLGTISGLKFVSD